MTDTRKIRIAIVGAAGLSAGRLIDEAGLKDRVRVEMCDYREFQPKLPFDPVKSLSAVPRVLPPTLPAGALRTGGL